MGSRFRVIALVGLGAVAGCREPDDALQGRVQSIEERLGALEQRLAAVDKELPTGERLRADLQAMQQRLGAVEAKATEALDSAKERAKAAPPPPAPGTAGPRASQERAARPARPDPAERRAQLGTLTMEYRRRLDELEEQQGSGATAQERMAARRAVRQWYMQRRRAILAGQPLPE